MKLFIDSTLRSAASMNERMPAEETPWASGALRGKPAAREIEPIATKAVTAKTAAAMNGFMILDLKEDGFPALLWTAAVRVAILAAIG